MKKMKKKLTPKSCGHKTVPLDHFQSYRIILRSVDTIQYPHTNQYPTLIPCIYLIHDMHRLGSRNTIYVLLFFSWRESKFGHSGGCGKLRPQKRAYYLSFHELLMIETLRIHLREQIVIDCSYIYPLVI